jgi:peptidoglycan/xylan/chitin deacetylase (PgdA/CDA1 family)
MNRTTGAESKNSYALLLAKILLAVAVCLLLVSGVGAYFLLMPKSSARAHTGKLTHLLPTPTQFLTPTQPAEQQAQNAAMMLANNYLNALLQGQYNTMWMQLHPDIQATWQNETNFNKYWTARFQDYTLQGFTIGMPRPRNYWMNPETMVRYYNVEAVSTSLQLSPKDNRANQPPENINPGALLRNLPFIVQQNATSGHWLVLCGGPADLEAPMTLPQTIVSHAVQVPILMYHHVTNVPTHNLLDYSLTVTPTNFGKQLDYLKAQGYHSITLNQLAAALYYGVPLPVKPVVLTFDDGYIDEYRFAFPILQAHNYSGVFYIITGKVGWDGQMNWGQLQFLLANGMQIGSHTIHHVNMGLVYQSSQLQARQELQVSQDTLQKNLHVVIQHFCYPYGDPFKVGSQTLRAEVAGLVEQTGYITATTYPGMTGSDQTTKMALSLLRIIVDGRETQAAFQGAMLW